MRTNPLRVTLLVGMLLGLVTAGCAGRAHRTDVVSELRAATRRYAGLVAAMDAAGITDLFTPDGEVIVVGQPAVVGRDAIRRQLDSFAAYHVESEVLTADRVEPRGDTSGTVRGGYRQRVRIPAGEVLEVHGTYVAEWVRLADGWHVRSMVTTPASEPAPGSHHASLPLRPTAEESSSARPRTASR